MKSQCVSIVVPPPIAAPCTATTIGFSNLMNASIRRPCGKLPGPGGLLRKSPMSLPAQNESPALCQSATRISSSSAALLKISARLVYMAPVMAFFFSGRLNWTRRIPLDRSVTMSLIVCSCVRCSLASSLGRAFLGFWHGTACAQALDPLRVKSQLSEDLVGVLAEVGSAPRRHLGDAVHLNGAADGRGQLAAGTFERNHDVVYPQLRIVDDFLWPAHGAEGDVHAVENLVPMRHRLCSEDFVEDGRELWHVRCHLCRIGEPRIRQQVRTADGFRHGCQLVGHDD